jgi:hypothetical protein
MEDPAALLKQSNQVTPKVVDANVPIAVFSDGQVAAMKRQQPPWHGNPIEFFYQEFEVGHELCFLLAVAHVMG